MVKVTENFFTLYQSSKVHECASLQILQQHCNEIFKVNKQSNREHKLKFEFGYKKHALKLIHKLP